MQPADISVELRPRSAWEAIDLGLAMLQRWWRAVLVPHAIVLGACTALACLVAALSGRTWLALVVIWWLKPLYDRVVLHVLSHAVFGELPSARAVFGAARAWLGAGLLPYLLLRLLPDMARSFALPVRQLEGSRGRAARERLSLLGRRTRASAIWLTIACLHFEAVLYWSLQLAVTMLLPAKALEGRGLWDPLGGGDWAWAQVAAYAGAVFVLEPFYVAGGFALYLNRRTLLEGWDLEVALRRLAERHAAVAAAVVLALGCLLVPGPSYAQSAHAQDDPRQDPRHEIAEVLKAPEFPHEREIMRWQLRPRASEGPALERRVPSQFAAVLAELVQKLLWIAVAAGIVYLAWQMLRRLRAAPAPADARCTPPLPQTLFGMELSPESLPADVAAAACRLGEQGRVREALALLYRGTLSQLVYRRGIHLLSSHTEAEVLHLAPPETAAYMRALVDAWRACAYASRAPGAGALEQLAAGYRAL